MSKKQDEEFNPIETVIDMRNAEAEDIYNLMVEFPGSSSGELFVLSEMGDETLFRRTLAWIENDEDWCYTDGDYYYANED
ncbi:MAG: hypothetical protein WA064_03405 [Candidatus Moraniibacteriota bacterium]